MSFAAEQAIEAEVKPVSSLQGGAGFQRLWVQRREAVSGAEAVVGEQQLEEIIELKLDKGIVNLWEYALLLIREGIKMEDKDKAAKLGEFSQRMAPDLPYVYFYAGQVIWKNEKWRIYPALEKYFEGIRAYTRNLPLLYGQVLSLLYLLGIGALLAVLAFCMMVLLKRLTIFVHVLKEELKGERKEVIRGVARIFLFFLPLLVQLNILWCVLFWCFILWGYLTRGEKGVLVLCLFLLTYIPPVGKSIFHFMESPEAQTVFDIYETTYGEREPQAWERLHLWTQEDPTDRDVLFTLALALKKEGDYTEARRGYQKVLKLNPSDPDVTSNLGNLYLALGEPEKAIGLYQQAIEVNPHNGVYHFNLSKALSQKSMLLLEDVDKAFQRAKELSPKVIGAHLEIDSHHPNRNVIDEIISLERLRRRLLAGLWRGTGPSFLLLDVGLRGLSPRFPFISPLIFFALIIVLLFVEGKVGQGWWSCSLCGLISSQTYARREGRKKICIGCSRILKGKEVDQKLKEKKLGEIKVFQRRMGLYDKLLPIILPGGGHVWKGYNLRGFIFLWIFFLFLGKFYYWKEVVPSVIPSTYGICGGGLLIALVFAIFYLLVLKGAYKKEGLEVFEPPFSLEGIRR